MWPLNTSCQDIARVTYTQVTGFLINLFILCINSQKIVKVDVNKLLVLLNQQPKPPNIQFPIKNDKEKQQILTFEKLELENVWQLFLKSDD